MVGTFSLKQMKEVSKDVLWDGKKNIGGSWILSGLLEKKISLWDFKGEIVFDSWKGKQFKAVTIRHWWLWLVWEIQIFIENPIDSGLAMNVFIIKLTDFNKNVKDSLCCNNKILKFQWLITTKSLVFFPLMLLDQYWRGRNFCLAESSASKLIREFILILSKVIAKWERKVMNQGHWFLKSLSRSYTWHFCSHFIGQSKSHSSV